MLAPATIDRIADDLLHQARTSPFGFTDPSGVPVSHIYRCADMGRLPSGLQQEIVRKAHRAVSGSPAFIMTVLTGLAAVVLFVLMGEAVFGKTPPYPLVLASAPLVPLLQVAQTRQAVRRIAAQVAASWPVATRL